MGVIQAPWFGNSLLTFVRPGQVEEFGFPIDYRPNDPFHATMVIMGVHKAASSTVYEIKNTKTDGALSMFTGQMFAIMERSDVVISHARFWRVERTQGTTLLVPHTGPWKVEKVGYGYGVGMVFDETH